MMPAMPQARGSLHRLRRWWPWLGLALFTLLILRAAWIADDAFITLRVIDNLVSGRGLRWNVMERVCVFTHPLWLFLLIPAYWLTREAFVTIPLVCAGLTVAALVLAGRPLARTTPLHAFAFFALLCGSRSVLSYATSGLENPLALLLLVGLWRSKGRPTASVLLASLITLCRLDLFLVVLPLVLVELLATDAIHRRRALLIGLLPLVAWELFSLVYFGTLVPNTALAKLGHGLAPRVLLGQGTRYYRGLGLWDPVGAALLLAGIGVSLVRPLAPRPRALTCGLLVYGTYVLWMGGDFMLGRFFAVPIVLSTLLLCEAPWPGQARRWIALTPLLGLFADGTPSLSRWLAASERAWLRWGIIDERVYYSAHTGLFDPARPRDLVEHYYAKFGRRLVGRGVVEEPCIGMVGYFAGPAVHIIDPLALADPLLARLPADPSATHRVGHYLRDVPAGYYNTLYQGKNKIVDADLARYYDAITLVTRAPIFSAERWRAIAALSLGRLDGLRDAYARRHGPPVPPR
jgi:arabinofuranosyltransferase